MSSRPPQRSPAIVVFGVHIGAFGNKKLYHLYMAFFGCTMQGRSAVPGFGTDVGAVGYEQLDNSLRPYSFA